MEAWQLGLVIVIAILVGALLPLIFLLTLTVNNLRKQIGSTGNRLDDAIDEIKHGVADIRLGVGELRESIARLNTFSKGLEGGEEAIQTTLKAVGELGQTIQGINDSAKNYSRIIALAGPLLSGFISSFRQQFSEKPESETDAAVSDKPVNAPEKTEEKP
jgi:uncharacterized protein YoxC